MKLCVSVPASTSNLGPGFDCLGLALAWRLELDVATAAGQPSYKLAPSIADDPDLAGIPADRSNLFFRAAERVSRRLGRELPHLAVLQRTALPISRGLGSSAAAIAAGLVAANRLLKGGLEPLELLDLGLRIEPHPDNLSAALLGGLTVSGFEGKSPFARAWMPPAVWKVVLLVPSARTETRAARKVLPRTIDRDDAVFNLSRTALLLTCLARKDGSGLRIALQDRWHQPYRLDALPALRRVYVAARNEGLPVFLSGSGPTLALFANSGAGRQAERLGRIARDLGWEATLRVVRPEPRGARIARRR